MNELQISKCLIVVPMWNIFFMLFSQLTNSHINEKDATMDPKLQYFLCLDGTKFEFKDILIF